jgi:hypothetical protein
LYILLYPVNKRLSLLTAWFRLVYTIISLAALLNLVTILGLIHPANNPALFKPDQLYSQIGLLLGAFRNGWSFAYIFFGIHLLLLGYLAFKSKYIPKIIGILLIIAGAGWLFDNIRPYLFPGLNLNFTIIMFMGLGELVFLFWLLIWGSRLKEPLSFPAL